MLRFLQMLVTLSAMAQYVQSQEAEIRSRGDDKPVVTNDCGDTAVLGADFGKYILIPGGQFVMGSAKAEQDNEKPEHVVELSTYRIGKTPVTNSQFVRFLNDAQIGRDEYPTPPPDLRKTSINWKHDQWICAPGTENDAASCATWMLAEKYCDWLSKQTGRKCRLPTEAEWEYACRGSEGRKFSWGDREDHLDRRIWGLRTWRSTSPAKIPVGSFSEGATPEGVCDLVGYMDEVCSDWYDPQYYSNSPRRNPQGPSEPQPHEKNTKVTRGGLERPYTSGSFVVRLFRDSAYFGILPTHYLPRGWSRGATAPPKQPSSVDGRLGFRVVMECGEAGDGKGD